MADKVVSPAVTASPANTAAVTPSKKAAAGAKTKVPRAKPAHPRTSDMVIAAITTLKERGGSSLQAIKKYIAATYKLDTEKQAPFIKKYLKNAVVNGALVQTKGKGASGSFKLPTTSKSDAPKPKTKRAAPKTASPKKKSAASTVAAAAAKKPAAAKKAAAAKKTSSAADVVKEKRKPAKSPAAKPAKAAKSPSKAKKAAKSPTSKPKAPKPKKAAAAPKATKPAAKKPVASKKK